MDALTLSLWSVIPFAGMLLSIAIMPLVIPAWYEKHQLLVAVGWALLFCIPFAIFHGTHELVYELIESVVLDYIPFIVLLFGLFVVTGGIAIKGLIAGTTRNNVLLLLVGTLLSSWIGTTGSAMLLIRPLLRANAWRKYKAHIVIFFIFLVANIGGCLTPLGDPPLFLGYLRGVPFFWTLQHIWPLLLLNTAVLCIVFALIDNHYVRKETAEGRSPADLLAPGEKAEKLHIEGGINFLYIGIILVAVILNGEYGCGLPTPELAKICQYAENTYFGKPSGLLDQLTSAVAMVRPVETSCSSWADSMGSTAWPVALRI